MSVTADRVEVVLDRRPSLALQLPDGTTFEQWVVIGRGLCLGQQALNWHIGDWWAFGDHRYGDRAKAAVEGIFGFNIQTLMNLASVSRSIETSRRREVLTWTHHAEVAALPSDEADELLEKAEREHLSTRDLRREVQALKAAKDPCEAGEGIGRPGAEAATHKPSSARELTLHERIVELADSLELSRALTKREIRLRSESILFIQEARSGCRRAAAPDDFDVIFVEQGRVECEEWFGVSRKTIDHWLVQRGKARLLKLRSEYVSFQRSNGNWLTRATKLVEHRSTAIDQPKPTENAPADPMTFDVAKQAAQFLRISQYGGWRISPTDGGDWFVGTVRKTSDDVIRMAEAQGFDARQARLSLQSDGKNEVD